MYFTNNHLKVDPRLKNGKPTNLKVFGINQTNKGLNRIVKLS
jgi:hypothetical protein